MSSAPWGCFEIELESERRISPLSGALGDPPHSAIDL